MNIYFLSLASGSSGNCYYLGTEKYGILIDVGISGKTIKKELKEKGIGMEKIHAIFLTHDHKDHIKGCGSLSEKFKIPVYATQEVHQGMNDNKKFEPKIDFLNCRLIEKKKPLTLEDFKITAFEVPHDGTDNVGYFIEIGNISIVFATDLGYITEEAKNFLCQANYIIIEANYEEEMLREGTYPEYLKNRILSSKGHLCNKDTARFFLENYNSKMKHIWLCHLSEDNNHPELAKKAIEMALMERDIYVGKDIQLEALKRKVPTDLFLLDTID